MGKSFFYSQFCASVICFIGFLLPIKAQVITSISVQGTRRVSKQEVLKKLKIKIGNAFSREEISKDYLALMQLNEFVELNSRVLRKNLGKNRVQIIFQLTEKPLIQTTMVQSFEKTTRDSLEEFLKYKAPELQPGKIFDELNLKISIDEIRKLNLFNAETIKLKTRIKIIRKGQVKIIFFTEKKANQRMHTDLHQRG